MSNPNRLAIVALSFALTGCVGIGGETIELSHGEFAAPVRGAQGEVALLSPAADERADQTRIGRATITLFALTSGNIRTATPLNEAVVRDVAAAFEAAGYAVATVEGEASAGAGRHVQITVRDFYFRNYNWFWPIVPTWGDVTIELTLRDEAGATILERTVEGSGSSLCPLGDCAFTNATSEAWTETLNALIEVAGSEEFEAALSR